MKTFGDFGIELGSKSGVEVKVPCPQCSNSRRKRSYPCLNVNTERQVWNCWHCGWAGGLTQGEYQKPAISSKKHYVRPDHRPLALTERAFKFFEQRGITVDVLIRNKIAVERVYLPQVEEESNCLAFPYFRGGEIVNIKYRSPDKLFRQISGAEKILYKYDDLDDDLTIFVEGEMDALSLEVAGFKNAVSVPDGAPAGNAKNFDTKFSFLSDERLDSLKKIVLWTDSDEPGKRLEEELCRRLGRERCLRVSAPIGCKDANDVLLQHGVEILRDCINTASPYPVEGVVSILDIEDDLQTLLDNGLPKGELTGWPTLDRFYAPVPGQWSLVTGIPSMGKSEWLDALAINLAEQSDWVFGVCSPENQPLTFHTAKLLEKRLQKRLRPGEVTDAEFSDAKLWLHEHFHFILPETPSLDSVLDKAAVLVRRHGMRGLIIDPYNELDHTRRKEGINETEYVSAFLTQLRTFARQHSVHVWLVAHPQKLMKDKDGSYPVPDGYSVSGSAHFYNKADNIVAIHRNLTDSQAVTEVHVQKVRSRWLGNRGTAWLRWRSDCGRFAELGSI